MQSAWPITLLAALAAWPQPLLAAPRASLDAQRLTVEARGYRLTVHRYRCDLTLELRDAQGGWHSACRKGTQPEFALSDTTGVYATPGCPSRLAHRVDLDAVVVGVVTILPGPGPTIARLDLVCTDDGILVRFRPDARSGEDRASCWAAPRLLLDPALFDAYTFWRAPDEARSGQIASFGESEAYAGVSPWGQRGDTAPALSPAHPALVARSERAGLAIAVVRVDIGESWRGSHAFLQRYNPTNVYLYPGVTSRHTAARGAWAWLAPVPGDTGHAAELVARLAAAGRARAAGFRSIAPEPEEQWTRTQPDFPIDLQRSRPVGDIRRAIVYTVNEPILSDDGLALARKAGSDLLIRGWFKWGTAPDWSKQTSLVTSAHAMGSLFGGGITCSALYHGESGLTDAQVLTMATRGPAGQLIPAWNEPNCRHGSLSSRAYLDFLLASCKAQVDAGADYLFMDEINAALQADEGFDDASITDFRAFLIECQAKEGWTSADPRWRTTFKVDLASRAEAPGGTMETFQYRAYLNSLGLAAKPHDAENPLASAWHEFRDLRDDRAWKWLSDAIRAHAAARGRRVLLSANGLARYVDLQVLGVWDRWRTRDGRVDVSESQVESWGSTVSSGWSMAGRKVPVVLFHDWGFGGFPWTEVSPDDRRLWMRVRGAEIYAAGGFFAFPVHGPFDDDARLDGTLAEIARQSAYYHRNEALYLDAELLGFQPLESDQPDLSLALWRRTAPAGLLLHVINRQTRDGQLVPRGPVTVRLPVDRAPKGVRVVSPDWDGEKAGTTRSDGRGVTVELPALEAYDVAVLDYDALPAVTMAGRRIIPSQEWSRPARSEFVVGSGGVIADQWAVPGMLQGRLHQALRNPPTFVVAMPRGGSLQVHVRGVATLGAVLRWSVDGTPGPLIELPDRDGKNDADVAEYGRTFEIPIPPGRHRVTLDNVGGDWVCIGWYAFVGETLQP